MAKQKVQFISARKSLFPQVSKRENFEIVSLGATATLEREGKQTELTAINCKPHDKVTLESMKSKVTGVYVLPTFNTYDNSVQVGDVGTVTIEKGTGENAQERFIFNKLSAVQEIEL